MVFAAYIIVLAFILLLALSALVHAVYLVPFVPSKMRVVSKMIEAAHLKKDETVIDLGCGDGRLLLEAEKKTKGIHAIGFEIAPLVFVLAWMRKIWSGSKFQLRFQSLFRANLKNANVIFCYLFPNVMKPLAAKIRLECKPGTRIISNTFSIPELAPASHVYSKNAELGLPTIYVYTL